MGILVWAARELGPITIGVAQRWGIIWHLSMHHKTLFLITLGTWARMESFPSQLTETDVGALAHHLI